MQRNHTIPVVLGLALVCGLASFRAAGASVSWDEAVNGGGDAGQLTGTAQVITGSLSDSLTSISGSTTGPTDRDIFKIYINDPANFTIGFSLVSAPAGDTIMALFNSSGLGMVYNDDIDSVLNTDSRLTGASGFVSTAGFYYLAIMGGNQEFASSGGSIWLEGVNPEAEKAPDGAGANFALSGYNFSGPGTDLGNYTVILTGVSPVPEPAYGGFALLALAVAAVGWHNRKSGKLTAELAASR